MKTIAFGLMIALVQSLAIAQKVDNVLITRLADPSGQVRYSISYDLSAAHTNIPCLVKVKFTSGDRIFFLRQVKGDVGYFIYPGKAKQITWDLQEELIHFSGNIDIDLEVAPHVTVSPKVKRSKLLDIKFDDVFTKGKTYAMKLYRHEQETARLNDQMLLENSFQLEVPRKTKVGSDYQLFITDGEKQYYSNVFKVKPKVALFWKILPFLAVPVYLLTQQAINDNEALPAPPQID